MTLNLLRSLWVVALLVGQFAPTSSLLAYRTQSGDTLAALATRFAVGLEEIEALHAGRWQSAVQVYSGVASLPPGRTLRLPRFAEPTGPGQRLLPDSEVVYAASAAAFEPQKFLELHKGFLAAYRASHLSGQPQSAADVIQLVALESSTNPRLLLALLEWRCGCVRGPLGESVNPDTLLGVSGHKRTGLYRQLVWLQEQLNTGYYGWRAGTLTHLTLLDGSQIRLNPTLNAGTVALQYTFAQWYGADAWHAALDPHTGFAATHTELFGNAWERAASNEPLLPGGLTQPEMNLPFRPGRTWAYTGGPHSAWEQHGPEGAIDLNPGGTSISCEPSLEPALAAAAGVIARLGEGLLVLDLDGDGNEHTGWVLLYVHLNAKPGLAVGQAITADEVLGHPACSGGPATSAHLHLARKYNGEWMLAGGFAPFNLGGWVVGDLPEPYKGTLSNGETTLFACTCATRDTYITRPRAP